MLGLRRRESSAGNPQPVNDDTGPYGERLGLWDLLLLAIPGLWMTGRILAQNFAAIPHPERYLLTIASSWLVAVVAVLVLMRTGLRRKPAVFAIFVGMVALFGFGPISRQAGSLLSWTALLVLVVATAWLTTRLGQSYVLDAVITGLAVFLLSGPFVAATQSWLNYGAETLEQLDPVTASMSDKPDIWLVVLDGYPGQATLELDYGIGGQEQLASKLESQGFSSPDSAWSSYATTNLSIPSVLTMGYPAIEWTDNGATLQELHDMISGDNALMSVLDANGYESHMIEAGWSGGSCGAAFENCIPPPLYDGAVNIMLYNSILGNQSYSMPGYQFLLSTEAMMDWMLDQAADISMDETPSFVFAHMVSPHPPLFLDRECQRVIERDRSGFFYPLPGVSAEDRDGYFREQLECVDSFVLDFVDQLGEDDVVVLLADHGTGRRAQVANDPESWSFDATRERMNVFMSVRTPNGCDVGDTVFLPNVMRRILSCLVDQPLEDVEPRMFIGPETEIASSVLNELLMVSDAGS